MKGIRENGKLSPASSASTLKEPSDKSKAVLERKNAYDTMVCGGLILKVQK